MLKAVENVNTKIADCLIGMDALDQTSVDKAMIELDDTPNKKELGANAILGASMAVAKAAAQYTDQPLYRYLGGVGANLLPAPMMNIVNGGQHADNSVDVQEFMVMPLGFDRFSDALRCGVEVFHHLKKVLQGQEAQHGRGRRRRLRPRPGQQRRGAGPDHGSHRQGRATRPGKQAFIALDVAATELYDDKKKTYTDRRQSHRRGRHGRRCCKSWVDKYPIVLDRGRLLRG